MKEDEKKKHGYFFPLERIVKTNERKKRAETMEVVFYFPRTWNGLEWEINVPGVTLRVRFRRAAPVRGPRTCPAPKCPKLPRSLAVLPVRLCRRLKKRERERERDTERYKRDTSLVSLPSPHLHSLSKSTPTHPLTLTWLRSHYLNFHTHREEKKKTSFTTKNLRRENKCIEIENWGWQSDHAEGLGREGNEKRRRGKKMRAHFPIRVLFSRWKGLRWEENRKKKKTRFSFVTFVTTSFIVNKLSHHFFLI